MNLKSAEIALESKTQMCAVNVTVSLYKNIILPALHNANSKDQGRGYFDLPKNSMQVDFNYDPKIHRDSLDWCWSVFDVLSFGPLVSQNKSRTISVSNLGSISESIAMLRRMLLVQSPSNERFVYNLDPDFIGDMLGDPSIRSASDYIGLPVEEQLSIASNLYRNILSVIIARHPRTIETQVNMRGSDMSLIVWGGFKSKPYKK